MKEIIKTYTVKVVREAGPEPITGNLYDRAEENITVEATSRQAAHVIAQLITTIKFHGQIMRVFIDGEEHFDESY